VVAAQGGRTHGYEHAARVNGTLSERRHRSGGSRRRELTGNPTRAALEASLTAAHGNHEKRTGEADPDWPDRYAEYIVAGHAAAALA